MKSSLWWRGAVAVALAGALAGLPSLSASAAHDASTRYRVFLIQGTPGESVDVSLDGQVVARHMNVKDIVGPLSVARGRHVVKFDSGEWVVPASFTASRPSTDIVLHLPAEAAAKPVVTVFNNDVHPVAPGKGRLVIAHTAVVPPADIRVNGKVLFSNVANGEFIGAEVPAQTYSADIVPTGQDNPLFGPVDISVRAGALTRVFAIGQPTHGGMDAIVQVLPLKSAGSSRPSDVATGAAGLVASPAAPADQGWGVERPLTAVSAALLFVLLVVVLRRRIVR